MDYEVGNVANLVSKSPKRKLKTPNKQTPKKENNSPKKQLNGNTPKGNNQQNKGKQTPKNKQTPKGKQAKHVKPQDDDEEDEEEEVEQVAKQLPKGKKQNAKNKQPPKGKKQVQKEEEEDSDEEMDDSEESVENGDVANKLVMESDDDDDDSDEEEEEEGGEEEEEDDDDEDEEEEASNDDDSNEESQEKPAKKVQKGKKEQFEKDDPTVTIRTIFVGNWPIDKTETALEKQFKKYGTIKSMRFRNIPVKDVRTPKKVAAIKKEFHPQRTSCSAFVVFEDAESAKKAIAENGKVFHNHHLRVECIGQKIEYSPDKAIFVGNLAFAAEDDDLWEAFEGCGKIHSVRVMRDQKSQMGKGYGYVNFESNDAVELAVNLENVVIKDRKLNICRFSKQQTDKNVQKRKRFGGNDGSPNKKQKFNKNQKEGGFAGQKAQQNNKNKKFDKGAQQKKQMQKKFNPKKKVAASE